MGEQASSRGSRVTEDLKRRSTIKIEEALSGKFFVSNNSRLLPSFDRENTADGNGDELTLGIQLGVGAFCEVKEITAIALKRGPNSGDNGNGNLQEESFPQEDKDETDEADFPVNLFETKSEVREYMAENCIRAEGGPRYALKQLNPKNSQKGFEQGLMDISIEAKFLACLNHPNVIKMRGIAGDPLSEEYGLVLDRLYLTLEDKMDMWVQEINFATTNGCGCLFKSVDKAEKEKLFVSAITVAYDLSCALRYIHSQNLVYRDIKPENAGFDVRGDIKLFDFGFCKELTKKIFDKPSGFYKLTRMTGSPPYMAPENYLGKPYGKPVDVFSFGILLWEMLHFKFAFYHFNRQDYKELVVEKSYRPSMDSSLSSRMKELIKESWDPDPKKRPTFDRISLLLKTEFQEVSMEEDKSGTRSERMLGASMRSFRAHNKK